MIRLSYHVKIVMILMMIIVAKTVVKTRIFHHHHKRHSIHQVIILYYWNPSFPLHLAILPFPLPTQKQAFQLLWDHLDGIIDQNGMLVNCQSHTDYSSLLDSHSVSNILQPIVNLHQLSPSFHSILVQCFSDILYATHVCLPLIIMTNI